MLADKSREARRIAASTAMSKYNDRVSKSNEFKSRSRDELNVPLPEVRTHLPINRKGFKSNSLMKIVGHLFSKVFLMTKHIMCCRMQITRYTVRFDKS